MVFLNPIIHCSCHAPLHADAFRCANRDQFILPSGSATTGIAANLLGRCYLGLEIEDEFLAISRARREEIERSAVRGNYLNRLAKAKVIPAPGQPLMEKQTFESNGVPWLM